MSNCQKSKRWTGNKFSDQRVTKLCKHLLVCYAPTLLPPTQFILTYICTMIWSLLPYSPFLDFQFLKPSTKTTIADLIMKHADLLLNWVICTSNVGVIKLYCLKRLCANIECHKILVFSPPYETKVLRTPVYSEAICSLWHSRSKLAVDHIYTIQLGKMLIV